MTFFYSSKLKRYELQIAIAAIVICLLISLQGLSQKDTIYFTNGSRLVGEVKKIKLGVITFDPDDANDVTIQLRKLKSIYAISRIFRIETIKGDVYFGTIRADTIENHIKVTSGPYTVTILIENISVLYPYEKTFLSRFDGNIGLGYSYTRSSGFGRLNFDGSITYRAPKTEVSLAASGIYTITDTLFSRDREDINSRYSYYFSHSWFASGLLSYQRNIELGLQRRYQEGVAIGNKFLTSRHIYAWGRTGFALNQEKSTENVTTGTLAEVLVQLEFNFFRFAKPEINFKMTQSLYYSLSQSGRFRNDGETNLSWEIFNDFGLNLGFYNNYDSKPPVEGSGNLDFGITFGIKYSF